MRAPQRLAANQREIRTDCSMCYMFLNIKRIIFSSMLHIPALWYFHISVICPHRFRSVKFVITPSCIAAIFVKYCFTNVSWLLQRIWPNLHCSGCSALEEKSLWNGVTDITQRRHFHQGTFQLTWFQMGDPRSDGHNLAWGLMTDDDAIRRLLPASLQPHVEVRTTHTTALQRHQHLW